MEQIKAIETIYNKAARSSRFEHGERRKFKSIGGVVFTRHNTRTILARDLTDVITDKCRELDIPVYKTVIREGVAVREAQTKEYRRKITKERGRNHDL